MNSNLSNLMASANRANAEGRFGDCAKICVQILANQPGNVAALVLSGIAADKLEDTQAAAAFFEKAIACDPFCAPAYLWLSMAHRKLGHKEEALRRAKEAVQRNPNDALSLHHLGLCFFDADEFISAESSFLRARSIAPNVSVVHLGLGSTYRALNRIPEAIAALRQSVRLDPSALPPLLVLKQVLMDEGDSATAAEVARDIVKLEPQSAEALLWLAILLIEANRPTEADPYIQRAIAMELDTALSHSLLGSIYQVNGNLERANFHFRKSIELKPEQGTAYRSLAANSKLKEADRPFVETMIQVAEKSRLSLDEQGQLEYGIGKGLEDLGEYEGAMEHFDKANKLTYQAKFGSVRYELKSRDTYDRPIQIFTKEFIESCRGSGSESRLPIFIIGMLRSGTTLAEQVLSSHPDVGPAGELLFWLENTQSAMSGGGSSIDLTMLGKLARRYEKLLQEIAPGRKHAVDKMPMNYQSLGLIHIAFPNAKIIHMNRNPVDTCISVYTTPNRSRLGWAHDKANIVTVYESYLRVMDHWRRVLPTGTMLDVQYEDFVGQPEPTIRSVIEFCGLDWNDACLHPELNQRSVVTPSLWQVRQPFYKSSVARWKKYEPWLGPLAKLKRT